MKKDWYLAKFPEAVLIDPDEMDRMKQKAILMQQARAAKRATQSVQKQEAETNRITTENHIKDSKGRVFFGKDLENHRIMKEKYIKEYGFSDSPELEELLFFLVVNQNLQEKYNTQLNLNNKVDNDILDQVASNSLRIQQMLTTLINMKSAREESKDVVSLHNETIAKAAEYIKSHTGEFAMRCPECGKMLDNFGCPHPFFEGHEKFTVFSTELWELVVRKMIPIEYMAYSLHTSVEGLLDTAKFRGDHIPEIDLPVAEKNLESLRGDSATGDN